MLLAALIALLLLPAAGSAATPTQAIAIPAYFYPGALWTQMEQASPPCAWRS